MRRSERTNPARPLPWTATSRTRLTSKAIGIRAYSARTVIGSSLTSILIRGPSFESEPRTGVAFRVHAHEHCANDPPRKDRGPGECARTCVSRRDYTECSEDYDSV